MPRPLRVFLCHASQDKPAVRELYNALKMEGWIDPWLDKAKILPGQDWELVIEKAVDDSDVVIACLSGQSITKEGFVQREIRYAYDIALEKPEETIFLIPLRLDGCNVPRKLRTLHWVDYFGVDKENAYSDLLEALKFRYDQKLSLEDGEAERRRAEEKAYREAKEKAKREADRVAKEIADREAEKAAQAKLEREAIQAAKEKADRETADRLAREQNEHEAREKIAREKAEQEKQARETVQPPVGRVSNPTNTPKEKAIRAASLTYNDTSVLNLPKKQESRKVLIWAGGLLAFAILALVAWITSQLPTSPEVTQTPSTTKPPFVAPSTPTKTPIPATSTATTVPTPALGIGTTMISEKDGMILIYVPKGGFLMGSVYGDVKAESNEMPQHTVVLDAFWIDQTEVTNGMYLKCVDEGQCDPPHNTNHYSNSSYANYPVAFVDWNMANAYCTWAGRRFPTEAEWEKTARGTDGRIYPWGDESPNMKLLNYVSNVGETTEVGKYPDGASPYGALDMEGNVKEWVSSLPYPYPYDANDGREDLNLSDSSHRVIRGGETHWQSTYNVRSALRLSYPASYNFFNIGFRCADTP